MCKILILLGLIVSCFPVTAQQLSVSQLTNMLDLNTKQVDTVLKKEGYRLMKEDIDSNTAMYQYSWFDRQQVDDKFMVRSLTYMDVEIRNMKSRLITYRTYNKEEFQHIAAWLLSHNYKATGQFDFKEAKHTLYSNGQQTIRAKVITTTLNKRQFTAYELELGK
jgi:hypothetical protein